MEHPVSFKSLPTEVVQLVGRCLDRAELAVATKICIHSRRWLQPLLWRHIKSQDWQRPGFPITACIHDNSLNHLYSYIQSLEWSSHELLMRGNIAPIHPELAPQDLLVILDRCYVLRDLMLFETRPACLEDIFSHLFQNNTMLKGLSIVEPGTALYHGRIQLESLFPWFSRLDKLALEGCWYYREDSVNGLDEDGGMDEQRWQLHTLKVPVDEISLVQLYPYLLSLELLCTDSEDTVSRLEVLEYHPRIQELRVIEGFLSSAVDRLFRPLCWLVALRCLVLPVHSAFDVDCIGQVSAGGTPLVIPALEHLELAHFAPRVLEDQHLRQALYNLLLRRPGLKILRTTIAIKRGYDLRDHPEMRIPWACQNLEQLHLKLILVSDDNIGGRHYQGAFWNRVGGHLRALPRLWTLSLYCWNVNSTHIYNILIKIGGARVATYTPLDTNPEEYRDHLHFWLEAFPRVRTLVLDRSRVAYIRQLLDSQGRSDIRCCSAEDDTTPFSA
ncbi:hypothetical protein BG003_006412 [Podila horticola]|nr:hypothetical protein BG003_006412 [Podila horticola]